MIGCSPATSYHLPWIPLAETACLHMMTGSSDSLVLLKIQNTVSLSPSVVC